MPRSLWLTEKEQKAHLMSLGVSQDAYLRFQWVVTNGAAVTVFTDNTKVVPLTLGVSTWNFDVGGAHTRERCQLFSFKAEIQRFN